MAHADGNAESLVCDDRSAGADELSVRVAQLTHAAVRDRLSDFLDDTLSDGEHQQVQAHLSRCRSCRTFGDSLRKTIDILGSLPSEPASEALKQRALRQVKESVGA